MADRCFVNTRLFLVQGGTKGQHASGHLAIDQGCVIEGGPNRLTQWKAPPFWESCEKLPMLLHSDIWREAG
ncbi:hypothetical protein D9M68_738490 [compost metagenome]